MRSPASPPASPPKPAPAVVNFNASVTNGATNGAAAHAPAAPAPAPRLKYVVEEENRALCENLGRPRTVLDVGCGIGLNGAKAKRTGAHVTGLEIVPSSIARALNVLDEVISADITSDASVRAALGSRRFDLVLFADVLEHTVDPRSVLERFLPYLEDGGQVIVSLPNVAAWTVRLSLLRGRFDYQPSGILDDTHLRFFTRDTARALVESTGLEVLRVEQNPMIVRAAKDLVMNILVGSGAAADPTALGSSLPYKAYQAFIRPLEDLVANRLPGLFAFQNVIIARKPPSSASAGTKRKLKLTVGMLSMNEEESVAAMIREIRKVAPDAQILCVDSSTKDKTAEIAQGLGARVLRQVPPRGHGPAMELLMYSAAKDSDALIYLDCDFTYPAACIPEVRRILEEEGADMVNCARTRTRPAAMPVPNYLANRSFAALAHAMHGVPTVDVHSGMRGYRCSMIRAFDFDGEGDALPIDTLVHPAKCGYRVVEMGIAYDERVGVSKLRKLAGTAWTFIRLASGLPVGSWGAPRYEVR